MTPGLRFWHDRKPDCYQMNSDFEIGQSLPELKYIARGKCLSRALIKRLSEPILSLMKILLFWTGERKRLSRRLRWTKLRLLHQTVYVDRSVWSQNHTHDNSYHPQLSTGQRKLWSARQRKWQLWNPWLVQFWFSSSPWDDIWKVQRIYISVLPRSNCIHWKFLIFHQLCWLTVYLKSGKHTLGWKATDLFCVVVLQSSSRRELTILGEDERQSSVSLCDMYFLLTWYRKMVL